MATNTKAKATAVSPEEKTEKAEKTYEEMTTEEKNAYNEQPVEIELFYDGERYADDVYVSIGNRSWQIKRGVRVTVPRCVAMLLRDSEMQKRSAALNERQLQSEFESVSKRFGL